MFSFAYGCLDTTLANELRINVKLSITKSDGKFLTRSNDAYLFALMFKDV